MNGGRRARLSAPCPVPAIEDEYSGPKLEDGKVTVTFMKDLMQWYKDQKKLHRKCAYQVGGRPPTPGLGPSESRDRSSGFPGEPELVGKGLAHLLASALDVSVGFVCFGGGHTH